MDLKWEDFMMKYFISKIEDYDEIGFDLDGTLYDEYDFISQAYKNVGKAISNAYGLDSCLTYKTLCNEWLDKGTSEPIFQLALDKLGINIKKNTDILHECLVAYRSSDLSLNLPERTKHILDYLTAQGKYMFLVTDGNSELQRKKIRALGLKKWFPASRVFISGDYGKEFQKPNTAVLDKMDLSRRNTVYIGDRDVDWQFAFNSGFDFICVKSMIRCELQ